MAQPRMSILLTAFAAVVLMMVPGGLQDISAAEAGSKKRISKKASKKKSRSKKHVKKSQRTRGKKRSLRRQRARKTSRGHSVGQGQLQKSPLARPSGELWVYSENLREEIKVSLYDAKGEFDDEALAKLDHEFRCRRTNEQRAFDPRLYEMLSRIQDHFKGKRIHLVSGFRFQRNEGSRHYHASAMDIRIPGISIRKLRAYAESLDRGGMGIGLYPKSNFVHVDFRAPGEPSYRWVDRSRKSTKKSRRGHRRSRRSKRRSPNA